MDAEQIRAEMNETRQRLDAHLDELQARVASAGSRTARLAGAALAAIAALVLVLSARRRRHARLVV